MIPVQGGLSLPLIPRISSGHPPQLEAQQKLKSIPFWASRQEQMGSGGLWCVRLESACQLVDSGPEEVPHE